MLKSKKGYKTLVTILALIFVVLVFLIFFALFKAKVEKGPAETKLSFQSIDAELVLKTFIQTPTLVEPKDIGLSIGKYATTSDLLTRTCDNTKSAQFSQFKAEAAEYFTRQYGKNWHLEIIYYTPDGEEGITPSELSIEPLGESFPPGDLTKWIESEELARELFGKDYSQMIHYDLAFMELNVRDNNLAAQALPCKNGPALVKIVLIQWAEEAKKWP